MPIKASENAHFLPIRKVPDIFQPGMAGRVEFIGKVLDLAFFMY
jgi:hypothetical protein